MTRVVLVDDHQMFRSGVKAELGESIEIVGEAGDVDEAIAVIKEAGPDVVLLDVHLPGGGGVEVLRQVRGSSPCRCPTPPRTSSVSYAAVPEATSPRRSPAAS